jgi:nucleoside-diphosphate-sugar epimerase
MKRVLVTGGTGFIGRQSLDPLIARGYTVHAVSSKDVAPAKKNVAWHRADLFDSAAVEALLHSVRPTHLLHFAWSVVPGGTAAPAENLRWVQATLDLIRGFAEYGGTRAVLAGSCAEYDWRHGYCVEDVTPLVPRSFYGICKNAAWSVCDAYSRAQGLSFAWGRIFFVHGPHEPLPRFVPSIVSSLMKGEVARCSHGEQLRDYLHVEDVAHAFVALLEAEVQGPVNIASGRPVRLREIAEHVAGRLRRPDLLRLGALPTQPEDPPLLVGDARRLTGEVGWSPRHTLVTGLDDTIAWFTSRANQEHKLGCDV